MDLQQVTFRVKADTNPGETVCITGDCDSLGHWKVDRVLPLKAITHDNSEIWTVTTIVPLFTSYRYVICILLEQINGPRQVIVRRWETNVHPRKLSDRSLHKRDEMHEFGHYGGRFQIQGGWMTAETLIQLKFYNNPIQIWKRRYADKKFRIKVTTIDLRRHDSESILDEESTEDITEIQTKSWPIVEVAVMNESECEFTLQNQFGRVYLPDEFMVFQAQILAMNTIAYMVDFFLHEPSLGEQGIPEHIGFCYILPSVFQNTTGICIAPITGLNHHPIGQMTVEYVVIRPMKDYVCDLRVSYAKHWKHNRKTLEVGHRGSGSSFKIATSCANIRENTIASLKHAANHGADYVEFDVQLSKDLVPIIYHDFFVCICIRKKYHGDEGELLEVPVQDLTFQQMEDLKVHHVTEKVPWPDLASKREFPNDDHDDHQPFPTLKKAFESVDEHVGFNVEIKWNLQRKDGTQELPTQKEANLYLDIILKDILENAGERRIIISCFHPDICTMIRLKQNKYPVLFLTQGQTKRFPSYLDPRTSSIPMAIYFAKSAGILGIDVHTEDILEDPSVVQLCKNARLIMFCWGEDNNDPSVINTLKTLGLHGVIYDKIDEHKVDKENIFLMEAKSRKALLEAAGIPCDNMSDIVALNSHSMNNST